MDASGGECSDGDDDVGHGGTGSGGASNTIIEITSQ